MNSMIRLCCCINRVSSGNPQHCCENVRYLLEDTAELSPDISLFPRLALCPPSSDALLENPSIANLCDEALEQLREVSSKNNSCLIVGLVKRFWGRPIDVVAVIQNGEVKAYLPASGCGRLPSLDGFGSYNTESLLRPWDTLFQCGDLKFCICPCPVKDLALYLPRITQTGCQAVLVPCYEPAYVGSAHRDMELCKALSETFGIAIAVAQGGQGDTSCPYAFEGHALICENGEVLADSVGRKMENNISNLENFSACCDLDCDILSSSARFSTIQPPNILLNETFGKSGLLRPVREDPFLSGDPAKDQEYMDELFDFQVQSLVSRAANTGLNRFVLGVSGGLDSTLALLVCHQALKQLELPSKNLLAVTMPGFGTTDRTYYNALTLISALGAENRDISIKASVLQHFEDIGHDPSVRDLTYENSQARERTQILFDIANGCRGIVIGTGDMSEDALGWCTFNGDQMAGYNVNVCLTKTMIRKLVTHLCGRFSEEIGSILRDIVDTPVSPELLPPDEGGKIQQKTEDILGSYRLHDFFLYHLLRYNFPPKKLYDYACAAFSGEFSESYVLDKLNIFLRRFFAGQFKRSCSPDSADIIETCLSRYPIPSDCSAKALLSELSDIH